MRTLRAMVFLAVAMLGCSRITDPGPVDDSALDDPLANAGVVNGMAKTLSRALGYVAFTGSAVSREVVAAGSSSASLFGITLKQRQGLLESGTSEANDHWQFAQQARWVAEDGVRRLRVNLGPDFGKSPVGAEGLVYAGFANRLLGENMCDAVIDGGPKQPRRVYFERAEAAFSEAITVAVAASNANLERAARAGRASVRVGLGNWTGASADAALIPSSFVYSARYSAQELDQYNRTFWANSNQPYRSYSVIGTFYETYFLTTSDPRTPWARNAAIPFGSVGSIPWYFQTKYDRREAPMRLVSGREMRLIVAEAQLRGGDWPAALASINAVRTELGVPPWTASSAEQTWVALKRERGIELWLEGRRLGDLDRWLRDGTPGTVEDMSGRNTCFPIGQTELDSNVNL